MKSESRLRCGLALTRASVVLLVFVAFPRWARCEQTITGFAVERFYPSAPGGGWFVMDDLTFGGKLGVAIQLTGGATTDPVRVPGSAGAPGFSLVSNESFLNLGGAINWRRYRAYFNLPIPIAVNGTSGTIGGYPVSAPAVSLGANPDTIAGPRLGFDVRILGTAESRLRLGAGAQLIFPTASRADYISDGRYRAMFRFLAAGDAGAYTWAGQVGVHVRPLHDATIPGGPDGNEFLFGGSAGRKISDGPRWRVTVGPEIFGVTAFTSFFDSRQTALEGLLTGRFEQVSEVRRLRWKVGVGHGIVEHFGAPRWRVLAAVELLGQRP